MIRFRQFLIVDHFTGEFLKVLTQKTPGEYTPPAGWKILCRLKDEEREEIDNAPTLEQPDQ